MPKKILINGAFGRMGQLACAAIEKHPEFVLTIKTGKNDALHQAIEQHQPDIVIDFTNAHCVWENVQKILQHRVYPIIGTSGLKKEQIEHIIEQSKIKKQGGLIIPNFSIGAVLQMRCAEQIAQYFAKAEIIEIHHEKKLDAPSGTALKTAERIRRSAETNRYCTPREHASTHSTSLPSMARTPLGSTISTCSADSSRSSASSYCNIPIHSVRLPGFIAQQEVIFGAEAETLSVTHNVLNREAYMPGLILACQKVMQLDHIHVGLEICLEG